MDYITILSQTLLSFVVLFILARLSGYRQISQMSMFDYINGITIGSIDAEMATGLDMHWSYPLIAMVGYGLLTLLVSCLSARSLKLRRFVTGNPLVLLHNGSIYRKNLKKAHVTVNEMLEECQQDRQGKMTMLQVQFLYVATFLSRLYDSSQKEQSDKIMPLANTIVYMEQHFNENLSVESLAASAGFSARLFTGIFKET